jgi:hypothetical protein
MAPMTIKQAELEGIAKWTSSCSRCGSPLEGEYGELVIEKVEGRGLLHSICGGCKGARIPAHAGLPISEAACKLLTAAPMLFLLVEVTEGRTTIKIRHEGFPQVSLESAHPFKLSDLFAAEDARRLQKWLDQHLGPECKCSNCREAMHKGYPEDQIPALVNSFMYFCTPSGFRYFFLCEDCTEHWFEFDEAGIPLVAAKLALMSARAQGLTQ